MEQETTFVRAKAQEAIDTLQAIINDLPKEDEVVIRFYIPKAIFYTDEFQESYKDFIKESNLKERR